MIFKSIELTNFRQFKSSKIIFSTDPKRNVTFVTGEITSGKSTLIKAFLWCLYRDVLFEDKVLLSQLERDSMTPGKDKQIKVELNLEHNDYKYRIITTETYYIDKNGNLGVREKATTKVLKISPSGSAQTLSNEIADLEINEILKKDLSPYFFFDGETSNIEELVEKRNIRQAISDIMGLKPIELLKKITNETTNDGVYQLIMKDLVSTNSEALEQKKMENNDLQSSKELLEKEFEQTSIEIKNLQVQRNEIISVLEANKDVEKEVEEKKRLVNKIEILRTSINADYSDINKALNNPLKVVPYLFSFIFQRYSINNLLSKSKLNTDKSLTDINSRAIDQIIQRGYCLCGEKITEGSSHLHHLIDQKNFIAPKNYGKAIEEFLVDETENIKKSNSFKDLFDRQISDLVSNIRSIEVAKTAVYEIDQRIKNRENVSHYRDSLIRIENQIQNLENLNQNRAGRIEEKSEIIKKNNEEIKKLTVDSSVNKLINLRLSYLNEIHISTNNYLNRKTKKVLEVLNEHVGNAFELMFNGERKIQIDDYFKVKTFLKNGEIDLEESSGLKTVKNFSFVSGLIKTSKVFSKPDDEMEEGFDGRYPLVMDAPFSKLGEDPIKRVSRYIPDMCDQIIIFVLNKDFQISRDSMKERIGNEYKIVKISGMESRIEEMK